MINAIICEFNPFHNGHKYLIETAKEKTGAEYTVCIMSGNFVQRGEPAVCCKHTRAAVALKNGADLVIQIPTSHTLASASVFAESAVFLADSLGVPVNLCFGSEDEDISALYRLASVDRNLLEKHFRNAIQSGMNYGAAVTKAYEEIGGGDASVLKSPNNLLAFEYIKAIKKKEYDIKTVNIRRVGTEHDSLEPDGKYASASFIRQNPSLTQYMPEKVKFTVDRKLFDQVLLYSVYSKSVSQLSEIADITEGLEYRFYNASRNAKNVAELYELVKSKRYTHAKIRRDAINIMLNTPKYMHKEPPSFIKVLGFNDNGRQLLKTLQETATLPVIIKPADAKGLISPHTFMEERASDVYDFFCSSRQGRGLEYRRSPVYVSNK